MEINARKDVSAELQKKRKGNDGMSVLARGLKMPLNCPGCFIERIGSRCYCGRKITSEEWNTITKRPDWCPLEEVKQPWQDNSLKGE